MAVILSLLSWKQTVVWMEAELMLSLMAFQCPFPSHRLPSGHSFLPVGGKPTSRLIQPRGPPVVPSLPSLCERTWLCRGICRADPTAAAPQKGVRGGALVSVSPFRSRAVPGRLGLMAQSRVHWCSGRVGELTEQCRLPRQDCRRA